MQNDSRTLEPGTLVDGRYEIVRRIGRGGFATVYRSKHIQLDRPAALKILDPITSGTSDNFIQRFLSEARIVANLRHPNVVMIYDFGVVKEDQPYLAMDLLEGHDLETELANHGPMSPERAKRLFLGVLDALYAGHQKQIVHKDLKPSNLFLVHPRTDREKLIVLDYGIARVADSDSPRLTQTGGYTGTPAYMPPEYIRESIVSPTNDVYQIGLILIEVMTGEAVINEKTSVACMVAHLGGKRNIPGWIQESPWGLLLEKALEIDHTQRFQDAGEFMQALSSQNFPLQARNQTHNENIGLADSSGAILGDVGNYTPYPAIVMPVQASSTDQGLQSSANLQGIPAIVTSAVGTAPLPSYTPKNSSVQSTQPEAAYQPKATTHQSHNEADQSVSQNYARIAPKPKKKRSKLIWFLLFFFVGLPMMVAATFLAVIYGYYGGFTEYFEALDYSVKDPVHQVDPGHHSVVIPSNGNPTQDMLAKILNDDPKSDVRKLQEFIHGRSIAYNHSGQLQMFTVSTKNYGYSNKEHLSVPSGGGDLIQMAQGSINRGLLIKGGPSGIDAKASEFSKALGHYRIALGELNDYYEIDEGYRHDGGAKGKTIHRNAKQAMRQLMESYDSFGRTIAVYYKATFGKCISSEAPDSFEYASCLVMLKAWDLNQAILDERSGESKALVEYKKAFSRLKKNELKLRSSLNAKYTSGQHTSFLGTAQDYHQNGREWVKRDPPTKWKNRIPLPDTAPFVNLEFTFLQASYNNVKN